MAEEDVNAGEMPEEDIDNTEIDDATDDSLEAEEGGDKRVSYKQKVQEMEAEMEAMRKALAERNKENQKRRQQIKGWDELGVDPDTVKQLLEEKQNKEMQEAEKKGEWEKIKAKLLEDKQAAIQAKDQELAAMKQSLESHLVDATISSAIAQNDGVPELLKDVVKAKTRLISEDGIYKTVVVDDSGDPRINENGDYMSVAELVPEFKEHPIYGMAFKAPNVKGMGTNGQGVGSKSKPTPTTPKKARNDMSRAEKEAFISEHGIQKYNALPLRSK